MTRPKVCGLLLAGGLARRMGGGDKSLKTLGGRSILDWVIERASPQVDQLLLNANGDPERFSEFGLPVVADSIEGFAGPLAGVLTGLEWIAESQPDCEWLVTFATDAPFLPRDLVERLFATLEAEGAELACASSDGRDHPVFGLWPVGLAGALRAAMIEEDLRKVDRFTGRYRLAVADWPLEPFDPFFNANRPDDLLEAEALIAAGKGA